MYWLKIEGEVFVKFYKSKDREQFLGRESEFIKINEVLSQKSASILVVYGCRCVGKIAFIEYGFSNQKILKFEGLEKGNS